MLDDIERNGHRKTLHSAWATPALSLLRAGRHLLRPYGEHEHGVAYDVNMTDGIGRTLGAVAGKG